QQRHRDLRAKTARQRLLLELRNRSGFDVVHHHQSAFTERLAHRAGIVIAVVENGADLLQITGLEAFPYQRRRLQRAWFDQADPGHPETALLNGDAAGFAQQFAAFAYAHDGGVDAAEHRLNAAQARNPFLLQPPIRNVPSHAAVTLDGALGVEQRQRIAVQPANAAIGVLQMQHHVAPAALLRDTAPQKTAHRRSPARRHDVETALAHELVRCITQNGFRRRAAEGVHALRVDFPDPLL